VSRDYRVYLEDILEAAGRIKEYSHEHTLSSLGRDRKTLDAIVRNLEIIGEAVKGIPAEIRLKYPSEDWRRIAGLRDVLIHEYFGLDTEIIWDIVVNKLDSLESTVRRVLAG
jgi:uncharacterized protein with HEPN domain